MVRVKRVEQAERHQRGEYHRWLKREARRAQRRAGKRYGEDAPTRRVFRGYET